MARLLIKVGLGLAANAGKYADAVAGLATLVAVFVALVATDVLSDGLDIEGAGTWVLATLIVWAVTMVGEVLLPKLFLKNDVQR